MAARPRSIRIEFALDRRLADWLLPALVVALCAGDLASESLVLSTYYPAPLGVYQSLISTGAGSVNTLLTRDAGMVGIGTKTNPPAYSLDVQDNGTGGNVSAAGFVQAAGGNAVMWGGTSVVNGNGGPGGMSFYGRPRIGDWGQWLELGEPNSGQILQISGPGGVNTGSSSGITSAPSLRNTLDDTHGNMYAAGQIGAAKSIYAGNNFYANAGAGYIEIGDNGCYGVTGDPAGGTGFGGNCSEGNACGCDISCGANGCYATWTPGVYSQGSSYMFYTSIDQGGDKVQLQDQGDGHAYWGALNNQINVPQFAYFCCPI